ncbi:N-dimethylarginine dimethylaminohydrolase [Mycolicibacterium brumae]|uniref:N-dimethylarginine dimethylaminohydrolase n=2 Tax=Mycolicibacterium brumae TaxID=85968 RepID=A0A2G5PH16_9MYCO|nr:N-dimethylarginine dimethylaminohydrolase [Mycolicibacterium brumae]PIB77605.1 N-dimethylarginine dimethylaminohydrolase [Mycolicibacterium brumae]RWA18640.1 hypothetical protein MBRU_05335 [Mycolicibacterium brumae DSM 44177]
MTICDIAAEHCRAPHASHTQHPHYPAPARQAARVARTRHYVMAPPTYFTVEYAINPWMDTVSGVDAELALRQWDSLRQAYLDLGHRVDLMSPVPGLPDMVFAANGGTIVNGSAVLAQFRFPQRADEALAHADWMTAAGHSPIPTSGFNEGQGDMLTVGSMILAGTGFRTDHTAHGEIAAITGMPVISLHLVDERFYHLDVCLAVLDDHTIAYYPPAFAPESQEVLRTLFADAIEVSEADALAFGLNSVSDGRNVLVPAAATGFARQLRDAGFEPIAIDLSELLKGGGSVKCCTFEVYS